jgi:two-component system NtrC family sensor kinase
MMTSLESTSQPNILVVDDNLNNLQILNALLKEKNYNIRVSSRGPTALRSVEMQIPDLILLDIMMPEMDGFEVCKRLKSDPKTQEIPIIFISALDQADEKVKAFECGAVDYITKPFSVQEVLARVETQLKLKQYYESLKLAEKKAQEKALEIEKKMNELQQAKSQLIQAEKMSALGQIVAGVAHEINNPISFIYGNLTHARQYFQDLMMLLDLYRQHDHPPLEKIKQLEDEIDFDFLKEDWNKLISSMEAGASRIREIVLSLRNFSRLGESGVKLTDIEQGIEETLLILQNRLQVVKTRPPIEVIKNYGKIPPVMCYGNQLNQVLMNLISNAIESFDKSPVQYPVITIETEALPDHWVAIRIIDNGCGIPQDIQDKIFDPFFTTKPIGQGTGLGLSVSHQIVTENHSGHLYCVSHPGQGSKFVIEIPIRLEQKASVNK